VDLLGRLFLRSSSAQVEFSVLDGIFNLLSYQGRGGDGLWALALALGRLPYFPEQELHWRDTLPSKLLTPAWLNAATDMLLPFLPRQELRARYFSKLQFTGALRVKGDLRLNFLGYRRRLQTELDFRPGLGIQRIALFENNKMFVEVIRKENGNAKTQKNTALADGGLDVDDFYPY
jgi:hypothetical protein